MKILLLSEHLDGHSGWATYTRDLQHGLQELGHTVVTVCETNEGAADHPILPPPLSILVRPWRAWTAARKLKPILEDVQPDVIHITVEPYAMLLRFLPARWRERTVLTIHGSYGIHTLERIQSEWLAWYYYRAVRQFITVSHYTRETVAARLKKKDAKLSEQFLHRATVIHNGIQIPKQWSSDRSNDTKQIALVGGVKALKGAREAVEACGEFRTRYATPFHLALIGNVNEDSAYVKQLRQRIDELNLSDSVEITGKIADEELQQIYQSLDLYLMPSLTTPSGFEGFGLVFLEANAYGVPCIGPQTSGAAEAVAEGRTGYHADPQNPVEIAERMHWILDERKIDPQQCRQWAEEHSVETMVEAVANVYEQIRS